MFKLIVVLMLMIIPVKAAAALCDAKAAHDIAQVQHDSDTVRVCKEAHDNSVHAIEAAVAAGKFKVRLDYDVDRCPKVQELLNEFGYKTQVEPGIQFNSSLDVRW